MFQNQRRGSESSQRLKQEAFESNGFSKNKFSTFFFKLQVGLVEIRQFSYPFQVWKFHLCYDFNDKNKSFKSNDNNKKNQCKTLH